MASAFVLALLALGPAYASGESVSAQRTDEPAPPNRARNSDGEDTAAAPASLPDPGPGIRATIERYFEGHATGDPAYMRDAFLPTAHIEGIRDGEFTSWTLDEYCALFKGEPAADEASRRRTIDLVDVSGNAAVAKATLRHGATIFTDYFVLLNVGGAWRIANKVYYGRAADDPR